jgi:ABC-type transport system substrate-binding protein
MFADAEARAMAPYDPNKAKQLLQEIGYVGNPITIELLYNPSYGEQLLQDNLLLQAQWRKVGINMEAYADGQRREVNPEKRKEIWRETTRYVHEQGYALWPYFSPFSEFWHPYVQNVYPNRVWGVTPTADMWLNK